MKLEEVEKTFWSKVSKKGSDECWLWKRATNKDGYGVLSVDGRSQYAHRLAYQFTKGEIPEGMCVCHDCDVPACCNPGHLFPGMDKDNMQDAARKGRVPKGKTHCWHRHPERVPRGEDQSGAKLTWKKAEEIRRRYKDGEKQKDLSARFGVSQSAISEIVNGKRWVRYEDRRAEL